VPLRGSVDQVLHIPIGDLRQRRQFQFGHHGYSASAAEAELSELVYACPAAVSVEATDQIRSACAADAASTRDWISATTSAVDWPAGSSAPLMVCADSAWACCSSWPATANNPSAVTRSAPMRAV
ncbi:hypothetical protein, partial [Leclercia adecarboxylata]|uniref:hypothetical protein n=1 Tax=Leclercia adecarboxylata TaxID=83655 RepID=UPI00234D957D